MKLDALDHPKVIDLSCRLGISLPQTVGHLEFFWSFVAQKTPQGDIGKWSDAVISRAVHWDGDPEKFVTALEDSGFIDRCAERRYIVHDWKEHMPNWVRAKLKRDEKEALSPVDSVDLSPTLKTGLKGRLVGKGREGESSEGGSEDKSSSLAPDGAKPNGSGKPKKRDELWDAMIQACGLENEQPTKSARGAWNRAVKDLREIGATPEQIHARASAYRRKWPGASLTPTALSRRWSECVASAPTPSDARLESFD